MEMQNDLQTLKEDVEVMVGLAQNMLDQLTNAMQTIEAAIQNH